MNFVLIDASYYIFFRYYALKNWWGFAKDDSEPANIEDSERGMEKFRTTFVEKIHELITKLKIKNPIIIVGKDCPQKKIWRHTDILEYKGNRKNEDNVKPMFECAFNEKLFEKAGAKSILEYPSLEADDCIAITAKHILEKHPDVHVHIITSDMDYLQIAGVRVTLIDLKYKKLTDSKNSFKDAKKDLFCKIVCGDKSDNIPSIFPRCGLKTAAKLYDNPEEFKAKLEKTPGAKEMYERNQKIIDFNYIPKELVDGFKKDVLLLK